MSRSDLVPVHDEPGCVTFKYEVTPFNFASSLKPGATNEDAGNSTDDKNYKENEESPRSGDDEGEVPDFLGFDDDMQPENAETKDDPTVPAKPPSIAQDLLSDYVAMGLIADPAAPTAQQLYNDLGNDREAPPPELSRVPWLNSLKGISSPFLRLHQEIVEFSRFVAPSPEEECARKESIARIQSVVQSIWPAASLEVFGSFATGLYLPTSDLDAVILYSGCTDIPSGLKALASALTRRNLAKNMQVISKARVPIIKFEETESGYAFDISFDVANGPEAASNVRALMDSLPPMRPLVTVIKVFLQQRELNEVYSGGLGSYAVLVLVASFLQMHSSRLLSSQGDTNTTKKRKKKKKNAAQQSQEEDTSTNTTTSLESNLGILLVDFFRLYGRALHHTNVGVSCRKGGGYFSKRSKGFYNDERSYLFAIEDPNEPDNDLGKNSFNASRARVAFEYAYCRLTAQSGPGESLLHRIIRLDPELFLREPLPHPPEPANAVEVVVKKKKKKKEVSPPEKITMVVKQYPELQQVGGEKRQKHEDNELEDDEGVWSEEERRPAKKNRTSSYSGGGGGGGGKRGGRGRGGGGWKRGRDNNNSSKGGKFKPRR